MKQSLIRKIFILAIILGLSQIVKAQTVMPNDFLKLLRLANDDHQVETISKGLKSISENWKLEGGEKEGNKYVLTWQYIAPGTNVSSAEFYLTTISSDGDLFYKISYLFYGDGLYERHKGSAMTLTGYNNTYVNIEPDGSLKTIFENKQVTFVLYKHSTMQGKLKRSYMIEAFYSLQ